MGEKALSNTSYDTYLSIEADSTDKYEFYQGSVYAMAGGTPAHSQIGSNLNWALTNALIAADKPCRVYNSDLKVRIESANSTFYPDVTVGCEDPQ
ncbi:MAG: Uma2 family endonuclease, partial [Bacteroidota bacterium]